MPSAGEGTYVCRMSPELVEKARNELNEDPDRRPQDIQAIRDWMKKQPYIRGHTDDEHILMFLRSCKFSLERCKEKIDKYYTVQTALPEWYHDLDPTSKQNKAALEKGLVLPLKGYDQEGRRVIIMRMGLWDPSKISIDALFRVTAMINMLVLKDEQTQVCGIVSVQDMAGMSASLMGTFTPSLAKKSLTCWQDCVPLRVQGFHCIGLPSFFDVIFNLFKTFMKDKLRRRVFAHSGKSDDFHQHVPRDILPEEYGGTAGPIQDLIDYWKKEVTKAKPELLKLNNYGVDENRRPGKPKTAEDLFGLDGSFRKLEVD